MATRAILLLVKYGKFGEETAVNQKIKRVAIPGMGTGVGRFPVDICAHQMKQAIDDVILEKSTFPTSWSDAQKRHQLLYGNTHRDLQF